MIPIYIDSYRGKHRIVFNNFKWLAIMKIYSGRFLKSDLLEIPEQERIFFLLAGQVDNDLNILNKLSIMCMGQSDSPYDPINKANLYQGLAIITMLVGKIYEGWKLIDTQLLGTDLYEKHRAMLSGRAIKTITALEYYFSGNNLINMVRQKYAFHYDHKKFKEGFDHMPDDSELFIYTGEYYAYNFYYASAVATYYGILKMIDDDEKEAMRKLFGELRGISGCWLQFIGEYLYVILDKYLLKKGKLQFIKTDIGDTPIITDIKIPYFARPPREKNKEN